MHVVVGSDHAGIEYKSKIVSFLHDSWQCQVHDVGAYGIDVVDYPDIVEDACAKFIEVQADVGILLCGSGIGMSIAANRYVGIRCALVVDPAMSGLAKEHNAANFLAFGARRMELSVILQCLSVYKESTYLGGRHQLRIQKIDDNPSRFFSGDKDAYQ